MEKRSKINWWLVIGIAIIGTAFGFVGMRVIQPSHETPITQDTIPDNPRSKEPVVIYSLNVSPKDISFEAAGGRETISISSNVEWTVTAEEGQDWLTIEPRKGRDTMTITLNAIKNKAEERSTKVSIKWTDCKGQDQAETIQVTQHKRTSEPTPSPIPDPPTPPKSYLNVNTTSISFEATGGTKAFNITSNIEWKIDITGGDGWLTIIDSAGSGNKRISINATTNTAKEKRTAKVTISGTDNEGQTIRREISISQGKPAPVKPTLNVNPNNISFQSTGEKKTFSISSNMNWRITINGGDGWLTMTDNTGNGNKTVSLTATANGTTEKRSAKVTVVGTDDEGHTYNKYISVSQEKQNPPVPTITKAEIQRIVENGQKSNIIPSECTIVLNGNLVSNYSNFQNGVKLNSYAQVRVTDFELNASRTAVAKIFVTAKTDIETDEEDN